MCILPVQWCAVSQFQGYLHLWPLPHVLLSGHLLKISGSNRHFSHTDMHVSLPSGLLGFGLQSILTSLWFPQQVWPWPTVAGPLSPGAKTVSTNYQPAFTSKLQVLAIKQTDFLGISQCMAEAVQPENPQSEGRVTQVPVPRQVMAGGLKKCLGTSGVDHKEDTGAVTNT